MTEMAVAVCDAVTAPVVGGVGAIAHTVWALAWPVAATHTG